MAVIKSADFDQMARRAIVLDLGDLRRQGQELERRAKEEAEAILAEARAERERILSGAAEEGAAKGHAEGLARGLEEGREAGRRAALAQAEARLNGLIEAWNKALAQFESEREEMLLAARAETMAFAATVAERITRRAIELNPDAVTESLAAALALTIRPTRLVIECHPEDRAAVEECAPGLLARLASSAHAEFTQAPERSRGSIIVRTEGGEIDASIETQLARLLDAALPDRAQRAVAEPEAAPEPADSAGDSP